MTTTDRATDSAQTTGSIEWAGPYPAVRYPPHTRQYLRDFLAHLLNVSHGDPSPALPTLTEPSLYTLAAALAHAGESEADAPGIPGLHDALATELRWRDCRAMGTDPTGPVRRGRLIQMAETFTPLTVAGASAPQRAKLAGRCPFCASPSFQVFLPQVRWRCFECDRQGALPEFAESLLHMKRRSVDGAIRPP